MSKFLKITTLFLVMTMMVSFCAFSGTVAANDAELLDKIQKQKRRRILLANSARCA